MPRPPVDLARRIKEILRHVQPLPDDAKAPLLHYRRTSADVWCSIGYIERAVNEGLRYRTVVERHLGRVYGMVLVNLVETFERYLKEAAAECVDCLAAYIVDDRFNVFSIQGSTLASHFEAGTLGKSLCESSTWLDCEEINKRFRKLLSEPFQVGGTSFDLFPKQNQQPESERWRFEIMSLIWQIRHAAVHNAGVITQSDAVKLRLWSKEHVEAPRILTPTRSDINYLKRFLDETVESCNSRIGEQLASLMTSLHRQAPTLFEAREMADHISEVFRIPLTVNGCLGAVPPE